MFKFIDDMHLTHGIKQAAFPITTANVLSDASSIRHDSAWGDQESISKVYENLETVYACVRFIANNIARVPLKIFKINPKTNDKQDLTDDPFFEILQKPNPEDTRYDFWYESTARLELQGELFWQFALSERDKKTPLFMYSDWKSEEVTIIRDARYQIQKYKLLRNGKSVDYYPEEVFFARYFNPYDTIRGLAPMRAARHSITLDLDAIAFNKNYFKQGGKFSGILSTEQDLDEKEARRFQESFEDMYQGVNKMHKTAVLWGGMKFDPTQGDSMSDMQFGDLRHLNESKILYTYGLFPEVLGIGKGTYQNIKFARRTAWTETLQPKIEKLYALINKFLIPRLTKDPNIIAQPDYSVIEALKEDQEIKVKNYSEGVNLGAISPNEMRSDVFNKEPYPDPELDIPRVRTNKPSQANESQEEPKAIKASRKKLTFEQRTELWVKQIKKAESYEDQFEKNISKFFNSQKNRVARNIDKYVGSAAKIHLTSENILFDLEQEKILLAQLSAPWIAEIVQDVGQQIMNEFKQGRFDMELPSVRSELGRRVVKFSKFVNETSEKNIRKFVNDTLQRSVGIDISDVKLALKNGIKRLYDETFKTTRAALIARTESVGSFNFGQQEGFIQAKIKNKLWLTSRDDKVRSSHQIDGRTVRVDEHFILADGSQTLYPNSYNERCTMIATNEPRNQ